MCLLEFNFEFRNGCDYSIYCDIVKYGNNIDNIVEANSLFREKVCI